jgi:CheY-like chemotaxis protein
VLGTLSKTGIRDNAPALKVPRPLLQAEVLKSKGGRAISFIFGVSHLPDEFFVYNRAALAPLNKALIPREPGWRMTPVVLSPGTVDMISPYFQSHPPAILVVDDDESVRNLMYRALVCDGYWVETAADGREAMRVLQTPMWPIEVVVLDVQLPDVSGVELCARMRQDYPDLPVIVCTGAAGPEEMAQLLQLGVRRYFWKPMTMRELRASVEASLAGAKFQAMTSPRPVNGHAASASAVASTKPVQR